MLIDLGQLPEALAVYREVLDWQEIRATQTPSDRIDRNNSALLQYSLARLLSMLTKVNDGDIACHKAIELWEKLAAESPEARIVRVNL